MFKRSYYTLQAKKLFWLSSLTGLTVFAFLNSTLAPMTLLGLGLGVGAFHLMPLLPPWCAGLLILGSPILALFTPFALAFNLSFLGLFGQRIMDASQVTEAMKNTHKLGEKETDQEEIKIIDKLQKKTNIKVDKLTVCDVDPKKFMPNAAAASNLISNSVFIFSNIMQHPFKPKERKAVYAHELGHLKNLDSFTHTLTSCLWYLTVGFVATSFYLPYAIGLAALASLCYYSVSQTDELLADLHSAQYSNPKQLISALNKLVQYKENLPRPKTEQSLWKKTKTSLNNFKRHMGLCSHPKVSLRNEYLESYAIEKEATKRDKLRPGAAAAA